MLNESAKPPLLALREQIADLKAVVENAVKDARLKAALTDEQKTMLSP
jgi:hypothetical protein